jgi:hypothetical protein
MDLGIGLFQGLQEASCFALLLLFTKRLILIEQLEKSPGICVYPIWVFTGLEGFLNFFRKL